mmetsp:Transcript_27562/g.62552  ORF Transcript_27562/g.62552 Transcript_27562/m.62552 type:complete len:818 (-) Transcript_27562:65-2518(-)
MSNNKEAESNSSSNYFKQIRRVKLYVLGGDGQWDDRGTGYVSYQFVQGNGVVEGLRVTSEADDSKDLLMTKIFEEDVFQRQGDTIVTWTNPETREDVALSFQEADGAKEIWNIICQVQSRLRKNSTDDCDTENAAGNHSSGTLHNSDDFYEMSLPQPEMENLEKLQEIVSSATSVTRDRIVDGVMQDGYLSKIYQIFRTCEDLEMEQSLHTLFKIFKGLIMLNEPSLIELCLSDQNVLDTMGILEYDPEYSNHTIKHREYLKNPNLFKEAVPIKSPAILFKIHLNFRLTYLKDVVMARYIDDVSFSTIRELILLNNVEIIAQIQSDSAMLEELFELCRSPSNPKGEAKNGEKLSEKKRNGFLFLRELLEIAKPLQLPPQMAFFRSISSHGLFSILENGVNSDDNTIVSASTDIMLCTLNHDPQLLRSYVTSDEGQTLLKNLIEGLLFFQDVGLKAQITEILRCLLDSTTFGCPVEREGLLDSFYLNHMDTMMSPFLSEESWTEDGEQIQHSTNSGEEGSQSKGKSVNLKTSVSKRERKECWDCARKHVVELLSFCIEHHAQRVKYYMMRHDVLHKVLELFRQPNKHLVLAALKFLRQCVGANDSFYNRTIVKKDLFAGVLHLLKQHLYRNNLVNSAIIELFDHIRVKNMKALIKYIVEKYRSVFEHIEYVETFKLIIIKYDQNQEFEKDKANGLVGSEDVHSNWGGKGRENSNPSRRSRGGFGSFRSKLDDDDDESYFDEDDEDDGPVVSKEALEEMSKSNTNLSQESSGLAAVLNTYEDVDKEDVEINGTKKDASHDGNGANGDGEPESKKARTSA